MAKQQGQATSRPAGMTLEEWMAAHRGTLANVLLGVAVLLAIIPLVQLILNFRSHSGNLYIGLWGGVLCLLVLFGGLYLKIEQPTAGAAPDGRYRLLVLGLGGVAGLFTFLLGLALPLGPGRRISCRRNLGRELRRSRCCASGRTIGGVSASLAWPPLAAWC